MNLEEKRDSIKNWATLKPRDFFIPILVESEDHSIILAYEDKYTHKTLKGCQRLCESRNNNLYYAGMGTTWIVAKYGDPKIV